MTIRIFKDPEVQAIFDQDGYVVVDFISAQEAKLIAAKFYELHKEIPGGFYSPSFSPDDAFKQDLYKHADQIFAPKLNELLQDFKKLGITFLCKAPGIEGRVGVHQDWTVVDETKYCSATIWVPTTDTSEINGTMRVLPGSHKFFDEPRSTSIPVPYMGHEQQIWDQMLSIPLKAGQAFVLNHAVIHASSANLTRKERLSIACGIIPKDAHLMFYHRNEKGVIEKYDMPDDFFMKYHNIGQRPTFGKLVGEFDYIRKPLSSLKLQSLIKNYTLNLTGPTMNEASALLSDEAPKTRERTFFQRVRDLF